MVKSYVATYKGSGSSRCLSSGSHSTATSSPFTPPKTITPPDEFQKPDEFITEKQCQLGTDLVNGKCVPQTLQEQPLQIQTALEQLLQVNKGLEQSLQLPMASWSHQWHIKCLCFIYYVF